MGSSPSLGIKKVAVIGGGAAGITVAKYLKAEASFDLIDVFEQRRSFGGLWNFSSKAQNGGINIPQTNPNQPPEKPIWVPGESELTSQSHVEFSSPMYEGLETNIPHFLMEFSNRHLFEQHQLFPSRESTLQYLCEDTDDVKDLVQFQTQVLEVISHVQDDESGKDVWIVKRKNLETSEVNRSLYDAIVVASGHYTVPYVPDILGISEWNQAYPGTIIHSKSYRHSRDFVDKKVIIIGYSASGQDIASHIATHSKLPVLVSQRSNTPLVEGPAVLKSLPEIKEFLPQSDHFRAVMFVNGHVETNIDAVVFCTGYFYSYPFLTKLHPKFIATGERVQNLYQHIFSIDHPTLAFIGIPKPIVPFPTCEGQAAVVARVWSSRLNLPAVLEMRKWEQSVISRNGSGRRFHDLGSPGDLDYYDSLVDWALQAKGASIGKVPPKMDGKKKWTRARCAEIKRAFVKKGKERHSIMTMEELGFHYKA